MEESVWEFQSLYLKRAVLYLLVERRVGVCSIYFLKSPKKLDDWRM